MLVDFINFLINLTKVDKDTKVYPDPFYYDDWFYDDDEIIDNALTS